MFVLRHVSADKSKKMIVSTSQPKYPLIIEKKCNKIYLSKLVPPTYEFNKWALNDLEKTYRVLLYKVSVQTGSKQKKTSSRLAALCYQLAHIYYEMENGLQMAEDMFIKALGAVKDLEIDPDNVLSVIKSLNMLAFLEANHNENTERAMQYLDRADEIYKTYCETTPKLPEPTIVDVLLECCTLNNRTWEERTYKKRPMINARLYTLFYYIEVYKIMKVTDKEIFYSHAALKLQMDNDIYMQCPLDWIQTCIQISESLLNLNAFQQAKHHMAAASMFIDVIIPKQFSYYKEYVPTIL